MCCMQNHNHRVIQKVATALSARAGRLLNLGTAGPRAGRLNMYTAILNRNTSEAKMKNTTLIIGMLLLLAGNALAATLNVPTITYPTIQSAITAASPGDAIQVAAGSYGEAVTVNKSVTIQGAQAGVDARTRAGAESVMD